MPRGCAIYIPVLSLIAIGVSVHQWNYQCSRSVIHIGVGLLRCSLRLTGQFPGASGRGVSDSSGLHVFFMSI